MALPIISTPHAYGWLPDLPDHRDYLIAAPPAAAVLPAEVDLRPIAPPVYDQGQLGSCTANGSAAIFDTERKIQGLEFQMPSRLLIYYNERVIEGTVKTDSGAQVRDALKVLAASGSAPESLWPYDITKFAKKPPAKVYTVAKKNLAITYSRVLQTNASIQSVLAGGHPIVFGFTVYESFESQTVATSGMVPMPTKDEQVLGGHCVAIFGYKLIDSKLYYIVRNSWGTSWGDAGYCYFPAEYLTNRGLASDFWVITAVQTGE